MSSRARDRRREREFRDEEARFRVRTASSEITEHYKRKGLIGIQLAERITRHARTIKGQDPEVAVLLIERAIEIEWQCRRAS